MFIKICLNCKKEYEGYNLSQKYCSSICWSRHYRYLKPEIHKKALKKYRENNKEKVKKSISEWQKNNKEKRRISSQKWRNNNIEKEKSRILKWQSNNLDYYRFKQAGRRKLTKRATPKWLTESQINQMKDIYKEAHLRTKIERIKYEVDHIIPINNKDVCGLHVPWNLQILTEFENISKHNKLL